MQRSILLISIPLATVILGFFFIEAPMAPRKETLLAPPKAQPELALHTFKPEANAAPAPSRPTPEMIVSPPTASIPTTSSVMPTADKFQNNESSNIPAPTTRGKMSKRRGSSPESDGISQENSTEETTELPPLIVPFNVNNGEAPAVLPAVLIEALPTENFTPAQLDGINQIAEDFVKTVTDPSVPQDAKSPEYQQRWRSAQATADDLFRTRYGDYAWMQRHNAAHREILLQGGRN